MRDWPNHKIQRRIKELAEPKSCAGAGGGRGAAAGGGEGGPPSSPCSGGILDSRGRILDSMNSVAEFSILEMWQLALRKCLGIDTRAERVRIQVRSSPYEAARVLGAIYSFVA